MGSLSSCQLHKGDTNDKINNTSFNKSYGSIIQNEIVEKSGNDDSLLIDYPNKLNDNIKYERVHTYKIMIKL